MKTYLIALILVLMPCITFAVECANPGPFDITQIGNSCDEIEFIEIGFEAVMVSIAPAPDPGDVLFIQIMMTPSMVTMDFYFEISCPDGTLTPLFDMDQPVATGLGCYDLYMVDFDGEFVSPEQVNAGFLMALDNVGTSPECQSLPDIFQCGSSFTALNETVSGEVASWGWLKSVYR